MPVEGLIVSYPCNETSGYDAADAAGLVVDAGNVALDGTATQSSTDHGLVASNGNDGNTAAVWGTSNLMTHTTYETTPWWQVDLGDVYNIREINVWGRTDQDQATRDRLSNFYLHVSDTAFASDDLLTTLADEDVWSLFIPDTPDPNILSAVAQTGRYVRVQLSTSDYLSVAEVQVFADTILGSVIANGSLINTSNGYAQGTTEFTGIEENHEGEVYFDNMYDGIILDTPNMLADRGTIAAAVFPETVTGLPPDRPVGESENRFIFGHSVGTWSNRIQLWVADGYLQLGMGDTHSLATDIVVIDADTWYHVILTWIDNGITVIDDIVTGTPTGSGTWIIYLDGISVGTGVYTGLSQAEPIVAFGNTGKNIIPDNKEGFDGYMDNMKLYDTPLTSSLAADLAYLDSKIIVLEPPPLDPPVVANTAASDITPLEITDTGGEIPVVTLFYGETNEGEVAASWDNSIEIGEVLDSFVLELGGLTHNTTYYFTCRAVNGGGTDWGTPLTFDTLEVTAPTLTQDAARHY